MDKTEIKFSILTTLIVGGGMLIYYQVPSVENYINIQHEEISAITETPLVRGFILWSVLLIPVLSILIAFIMNLKNKVEDNEGLTSERERLAGIHYDLLDNRGKNEAKNLARNEEILKEEGEKIDRMRNEITTLEREIDTLREKKSEKDLLKSITEDNFD